MICKEIKLKFVFKFKLNYKELYNKDLLPLYKFLNDKLISLLQLVMYLEANIYNPSYN
jgi:hypothetical protein